MQKLTIWFLLCTITLLVACTPSSEIEPSNADLPPFPVHLVEKVNLMAGPPLEDRQLAYCIHESGPSDPAHHWDVKIGNPLTSSGFYVNKLVPQATTTDIGCIGQPAGAGTGFYGLDWSPDGHHLLYNFGNDTIVKATILPDGQTATVAPLLTPPQYTFYDFAHVPTWSAQQSHVAFISQFQEGAMEVGQPLFAPSVFIVNADSSDPRFFVQENRLPGVVSSPVWSTNGERLAYVLPVPGNGIGLINIHTGSITNLDSSTLVEIPEGTIEPHGILPKDAIAWLPGDNLILFLTNSSSEVADILWLMESDGSNPVKLYEGNIKELQLSPDGSVLALIVNERSDDYTIKTLTLAETMEFQEIVNTNDWSAATNDATIIRDLAWSTDGHYLAFAGNPTDNFELFAWDKETQEIIQLTNTPSFDELAPQWRPPIQ
jgi:hypothetical protein